MQSQASAGFNMAASRRSGLDEDLANMEVWAILALQEITGAGPTPQGYSERPPSLPRSSQPRKRPHQSFLRNRLPSIPEEPCTMASLCSGDSGLPSRAENNRHYTTI
eukprot:TRINITY_DN46312_c0_g1_i1.p1 TRINITY_DN46312_c0_g1~~TRINITY_DN46312_c0_g1_i1.p1  ORF type:complete len:107 (-),score=19.34 TRINITY_DN46312_c0_g1_i1:238-558(-)